MALVANGVEVSLIPERMEGSEQPTHQPVAAPAHRHTHTHAHKYYHIYRSACILATRMALVRWHSPWIIRWKKIEMTKFYPKMNLMQSIALGVDRADSRSCTHVYTHTHSVESFHLARAHTLTHSHTFVHANRVLPDGLLPEQKLHNRGLFQTANFKLKQRGTSRFCSV